MKVCLGQANIVLSFDPNRSPNGELQTPKWPLGPNLVPRVLHWSGLMDLDKFCHRGTSWQKEDCFKWGRQSRHKWGSYGPRKWPFRRNFGTLLYCSQTAGRIWLIFGTEVYLGKRNTVLSGNSNTATNGSNGPPKWSFVPNFGSPCTTTKQLDGHGWFLAWRYILAKMLSTGIAWIWPNK